MKAPNWSDEQYYLSNNFFKIMLKLLDICIILHPKTEFLVNILKPFVLGRSKQNHTLHFANQLFPNRQVERRLIVEETHIDVFIIGLFVIYVHINSRAGLQSQNYL